MIDSLESIVVRVNTRGTYDLHLRGSMDVIACMEAQHASVIVAHAKPSLIGSFCTEQGERLWDNQGALHKHCVDAEGASATEPGDTSVVVAVIDTGVNLNHTDIRRSLWRNWDEEAGDNAVNRREEERSAACPTSGSLTEVRPGIA